MACSSIGISKPRFSHVLVVLLGCVIVLLGLISSPLAKALITCNPAIVLSGCSTSNALGKNIYIASLNHRANSEDVVTSSNASLNLTTIISDFQVRIGYFGVCAASNGPWRCRSNIEDLGDQHLLDPQSQLLMSVAVSFQSRVIFSGLLIGSLVTGFVSMIVLVTFPGWRRTIDEDTGSFVETIAIPSQRVYDILGFIVFLSATLSLLGVFWQHTAVVTMMSLVKTISSERMEAKIGLLATILSWIAVFVHIMVLAGVLVIRLLITVLDALAPKDKDDLD